jgi:hypothetical protein
MSPVLPDYGENAMTITPPGLETLARLADLRIEALNTPTAPGQPQDFQIRPASLQFVPTPSTLPSPLPSPLTASQLNGLIATDEVLNAASAVKMEVAWGVEDRNGNAVGQDKAIVCSRGTDTAANLAKSLQATVLVLPDFVELVRDATALPIKTRYVTASVTLSVGKGGPRERIKLPLLRYPITVPAIPIPTLAVFFAKRNLGVDVNGELQSGDQFALIVVPQNSPIGDLPALRAILETLSELMRTVDNIKTLAGLAGNVLPALSQLTESANTLTGALNAHVIGSNVGIAFVAADRIPNLNDVDTIKRGIFHNDIEAEDTISSLVLLGPPGRRLRCFQDRGYTGRALTVATGGACTAIVVEMNHPSITVLPPKIDGLEPPSTTQMVGELDNRMSSLAFL